MCAGWLGLSDRERCHDHSTHYQHDQPPRQSRRPAARPVGPRRSGADHHRRRARDRPGARAAASRSPSCTSSPSLCQRRGAYDIAADSRPSGRGQPDRSHAARHGKAGVRPSRGRGRRGRRHAAANTGRSEAVGRCSGRRRRRGRKAGQSRRDPADGRCGGRRGADRRRRRHRPLQPQRDSRQPGRDLHGARRARPRAQRRSTGCGSSSSACSPPASMATTDYTAADFRGRTAIVLGSEAHGLSDHWRAADITADPPAAARARSIA